MKLRLIGTVRSGVDSIDIEAATRKRILVISTPNHNSLGTAEYTVGLILAETRNIARSHASMKEGLWRETYPNTDCIPELNGSTIGVIGFGHIGRHVCRLVSAFRAEVIVYDPFISDEEISRCGYIPEKIAELLKKSDIVTIHARLTAQTTGLVGKSELKLMKSSSYLINTANSGLIDMEALYHALKEKWIAGAAIDVFPNEPLRGDEPLLSLDNITLTSHRAGDTKNAYYAAPKMLSEQLKKYIKGELPDFTANKEIYSRFTQ